MMMAPQSELIPTTKPLTTFMNALLEGKNDISVVSDDARFTITISPRVFRKRSSTSSTTSQRWETSVCANGVSPDNRLQERNSHNCLPPNRLCRLPSIDLTADIPITPVSQTQQPQYGYDNNSQRRTLGSYLAKTNRWENLTPTNAALPHVPPKGNSPESTDSNSSSSSSSGRRRYMQFRNLPNSLAGRTPYDMAHCQNVDGTLDELLSSSTTGDSSVEDWPRRGSFEGKEFFSPRRESFDSSSSDEKKEKALPRRTSNCNFASVLSPPHKFSACARGA